MSRAATGRSELASCGYSRETVAGPMNSAVEDSPAAGVDVSGRPNMSAELLLKPTGHLRPVIPRSYVHQFRRSSD